MVLALWWIAAAQAATVLIIESYHHGHPWDTSYIQGIREGMTGDILFYTFEMDTKRILESEFEKKAEDAWAYYQAINPALVFLGDDNALKYLGPKFARVKTPAVFLGINNNPRAYHVLKNGNITGVLERPLIKRSIVEMNKILDMAQVLVLFDAGTTSRVVFDEVFRGKEQIRVSGIRIHMKLTNSWGTWQQIVGSAHQSGYDAVMIGLYHTLTDKDGTHVPAADVLHWTCAATQVPPFAFWDFTVGKDKAIGGLTLFGKSQGLEAAQMGMAILKGTPPEKIKVKTGKTGRLLFSRSQLEKHGIRLPRKMADAAKFVE
tara:strand:- start:634 stop:1587 length:954 start_codon:yes stop_codon:yes gene_type:complete